MACDIPVGMGRAVSEDRLMFEPASFIALFDGLGFNGVP